MPTVGAPQEAPPPAAVLQGDVQELCRRVDGCKPRVSLTAICLDGRFLPTVTERSGMNWVVLNARLARFCGVSAFPENSVVHDIRAAILGLRGKSKSGVNRLDSEGNPSLTCRVEVRDREVEVYNQAWPIHVRPEDLDWVVGELFAAAQAK